MRHFKRNEKGQATFIIILLMFPLMLGFFGLAVDTARGTYLRQSVQNNLDSALASSASQVLLNGRIDAQASRKIAVELYSDNRRSNEGSFRCAKTSDLKVGEVLAGKYSCKWILSSFSLSPDGKTVRMTVRENTPNAFLQIVGIKEFNLKASASAKLTAN
jgi:Putative Flp pilus-assembly TadE/G-like